LDSLKEASKIQSYQAAPNDPFFAEGEKTIAYEICKQLN